MYVWKKLIKLTCLGSLRNLHYLSISRLRDVLVIYRMRKKIHRILKFSLWASMLPSSIFRDESGFARIYRINRIIVFNPWLFPSSSTFPYRSASNLFLNIKISPEEFSNKKEWKEKIPSRHFHAQVFHFHELMNVEKKILEGEFPFMLEKISLHVIWASIVVVGAEDFLFMQCLICYQMSQIFYVTLIVEKKLSGKLRLY